jgi:prevent-host-death family protein
MGTSSERAGIRELRQHASRYVDLASEGHVVDITNRGQVVARLVPAGDLPGPLGELVGAGVVRAPDDRSELLDVLPVVATGKITISEALDRQRDDERW